MTTVLLSQNTGVCCYIVGNDTSRIMHDAECGQLGVSDKSTIIKRNEPSNHTEHGGCTEQMRSFLPSTMEANDDGFTTDTAVSNTAPGFPITKLRPMLPCPSSCWKADQTNCFIFICGRHHFVLPADMHYRVTPLHHLPRLSQMGVCPL